MDENLVRLNNLFPNSGYVQIRKYDASLWEGREYNSHMENKAPLNQWKTSPLSYDQACKAAEEGFRIGWVVPYGFVIVDIDNEDCDQSSDVVERIIADKQIKCCYNRTNRGIHILFRDKYLSILNSAVSKCGIGITVDHRANEKGYIILPTNDPHRTWGEWIDTDEVEEIPFFLAPLMSAKNEIQTFIGMGVGDGRNNELFKWRTKLLQSDKLTNEQIAECLNLINTYEFEVPLGDDEMRASVTRERPTDEKQRSGKNKLNALEKTNIYNEVANKITADMDMMCIGYKQFYKFDKTHYEPLKEIDVERLIHYDVSQNISGVGRKEVMNFLALKTLVDPEDVDKIWNKIAVGNGVLDVVTGELSEPSKEEKNTIAIPWNYNKDPLPSPKIDEFMTHLSADADGTPNEMKKQFLYQIAGYTLLKKNFFGKFFIFQGDGGTGKSTFQDLIVKMVGDNNRARVGIDKMDDDYFLAMLLGKLVNIDDDAMDGKKLANTGRFKSLVSGNEITVRQIFKEPITFIPFATCMFSCNKLPRIMDKTSGLYRRLVIIELNHKIEKPDPLFIMKLTARDMEYFLYKAVYWVGKALQEGQFRISQSEKELLRKFKCRQSSINEWIYEENITLGDVYEKGVQYLYTNYIEWAQLNGYQGIPSMLSFKEDMTLLFDVEVAFSGAEHRASQQKFSRRVAPTEEELKKTPF